MLASDPSPPATMALGGRERLGQKPLPRASRVARVMVLVDTLAAGGAERVAVDLACGVDRRAFDPHVVVTKRGGPLEESLIAAGVRYTVLARRRKTAVRPALRVLQLARDSDLIHSHLFGNNVWGALLARAAGTPLLAHEHNRVNRTRFEPIFDRRLIGPTAHRILCVSEQVARPLAAVGVDPRAIEILPNGVHLDRALGRRDARTELGLADDDVVVGTVASLRPEKAHDVLLEAFAAVVRGRWPTVRLCLVGDGSERMTLQAHAVRLGIENRVIWAGERREAARLPSAFDLAVLCSRNEGLPLAALEAMAAGTPLICSRAGSMPALLRGGAGLLVEPDDAAGLAAAIAGLLADRERAGELARRGRELVATKFDVAAAVRHLEEIYEAVLEEARAAERPRSLTNALAAVTLSVGSRKRPDREHAG